MKITDDHPELKKILAKKDKATKKLDNLRAEHKTSDDKLHQTFEDRAEAVKPYEEALEKAKKPHDAIVDKARTHRHSLSTQIDDTNRYVRFGSQRELDNRRAELRGCLETSEELESFLNTKDISSERYGSGKYTVLKPMKNGITLSRVSAEPRPTIEGGS